MKKYSKIFILSVAVGLSMFTIGCAESDEMTDITPVREQPQQEEENEPEPEEPLSDEYSQNLTTIGFTDVKVEDFTSQATGETCRYYTFFFDQLVDHYDASKGTFKQQVRIRLNAAKDLTAPVVLYTHGYNMPRELVRTIIPELTKLLNANTVYVEHRYFDKSLPEPFDNLDFTYFNADQEAQDLHAIIDYLKQTFFKNSGKWCSTGVSKDGITTGLYAYYSDKYGWDDIDLYMPFCAPFLEATPASCDDSKVGQYLYNECGKDYPAGSQEYIAYQRLRKMPQAVISDEDVCKACLILYNLKNTGSYLNVIYDYGRDAEKASAGMLGTYFNHLFQKFSYIPFKQWSNLVPDVDAALATATTEEEIANKRQAAYDVAQFMLLTRDELIGLVNKANERVRNMDGDVDEETSGMSPYTYSDNELLSMRSYDLTMPYFVQAVRELGNVRMDFSSLEGMSFPGYTDDFGFLAADVAHQFEVSTLYGRYASQWDGGALMKSFRQWVKTQNKYNMIFCYSANDPWTGGAIDASTNPRVVRFICHDGTHNDYFRNTTYYSTSETETLIGHINSFLGM